MSQENSGSEKILQPESWDEFEEIRKSSRQLVVLICVDWCKKCKVTAPNFKKVAGENWQGKVEFVFLDADKTLLPEAPDDIKNEKVATVLFFRGGVLIGEEGVTLRGELSEAGIRTRIQEIFLF